MRIKSLGAAGLALLLSSTSFAADVPARSPIRMNQLGFQPSAAKIAILPATSDAALDWTLVDAAGGVAARGKTQPFGADAASGETVHRIDFSSFGGKGEGFRLRVGDAESRPFPIGTTALSPLKEDALSYFYHNRAGTPIKARFAGGEQWARPAGHVREVAGCFAGRDTHGNDWPGCDYTLDVTGGWYDAGDHGKYVVNGGISLWTLLNLHERLTAKGLNTFADGSLAIPEAGNGTSDLLDHARWQMEFMLAMQVPEGKRARVPVGQKQPKAGLTFTDIDASGMAHHKVADEKWTGLPTPPHLDRETRLLFAPTTAATLNLAATAAQCARVWRTVDAPFAERCLSATRRAHAAARRNPEVYAAGDFAGSGNYGDGELADEFYWAAAELFVTTGEQAYATELTPPATLSEPSWPQVATLGTITLALSGPEGALRQSARARLVEMANGFLADRERTGYAIPYAPAQYPWGSNSGILNRAVVLSYAYDLTSERRYRDGVTDALDYVLGRNPLDQSYVSGFGARPLMNPHHRFWAHQLGPKSPLPPPGAVSGGPNSISFSDDVAKPMRGTCAPQLCWVDDIPAFTMNEVAINWNAPLVWVATFADEGQP